MQNEEVFANSILDISLTLITFPKEGAKNSLAFAKTPAT